MGLSDYDNKLVRTTSGPSESIKSGKNRKRSSSVSLLKSGLIVEEIDLRAEEREAKERDISAAREARRKMSASTPEPSRSYSGPVPPVPKLSANNSLPEDDRRRFSSPMPDLSAGHHSIPRRSGAMPSSTNRSGSAQDLRAISGAMLSANPPASPASSLAPPTRPFATGSPRSPSRTGGAGASTLSLAQSGSMIDMHVGLEDGVEHRMSQAGFVPGTPVQVESPSMINRAYYGFPGDGEDGGGMGRSLPPQPVPEEEQDVARQVSRDTGGDDSLRKKKKGFKGFFQKITGGGNNATTGGATAQQASREQARQSSSSGSPRARRASLGPENSLELPPPPGFSALLNRARRSTSSLINSQAGQGQSQAMNDAADRARSGSPAPGTGPYQNPLGPGMASQISLDPGPFGAGTGAGGRERDLGPFHSPNSPHSPQHPSRVDQVRGAGGRLRTNSSNPNMSAHMSPSMNANSNANAANHPGSPQMQMYNGSPGSPYSIARRFSQAQQVGGGTESRTNSIM